MHSDGRDATSWPPHVPSSQQSSSVLFTIWWRRQCQFVSVMDALRLTPSAVSGPQLTSTTPSSFSSFLYSSTPGLHIFFLACSISSSLPPSFFLADPRASGLSLQLLILDLLPFPPWSSAPGCHAFLLRLSVFNCPPASF